MPASLGTRPPATHTLAVVLVSSALLLSACGSIPYGNAAANNAGGNTASGRPNGAVAGGRQGRGAAPAASGTNP